MWQSLAGLKITGVRDVHELKRKAAADWKVVLFMAEYMAVPPEAVVCGHVGSNGSGKKLGAGTMPEHRCGIDAAAE